MSASDVKRWKEENPQARQGDEDAKIEFDHPTPVKATDQAALDLVREIDPDQDTRQLLTPKGKVSLERLDRFNENHNDDDEDKIKRLRYVRKLKDKKTQFVISVTHATHWKLSSTGKKAGADEYRTVHADLLKQGPDLTLHLLLASMTIKVFTKISTMKVIHNFFN